MNVRWVASPGLSWHIVRTPSRMPEMYRTLCGRTRPGPDLEDRPEGKTCETCLRIGGPK